MKSSLYNQSLQSKQRRGSLACWLTPLTLVLVLLGLHQGEAQLTVRVSVKLLYDDTKSPPIPPGGDANGDGVIDANHCGSLTSSAISCDEEILEKWAYVNEVMRRLQRGYRFAPIEIVHLTNPPTPPLALGTNTWTLADPGADTEDLLSAAAKANPVGYAYRPNAINYYVFNENGGGYADNELKSANNDICTTSQGNRGSWPRFLHEIGHYLGLYHTFGTGAGQTNEIPSDNVCDTLFDQGGSAQTLDGLAQLNYQTNFLALECSEQEQIFDIYYNIMSYHSDNGHTGDGRLFDIDSVVCGNTNVAGNIRHRLTRDQLDRITNRLNNLRTVGIVSGRTIFVSQSYDPCESIANTTLNDCDCDQAPRDINGTPENPKPTVASGLLNAATDSNEDILLIRAGDYDETFTINQRVTLRATRGDVVIGR